MSDNISALHGDALDEELARHFTVATEEVTVGNYTYVLKKPSNSDHLISEADYVMDERLPYWADLWPSSRILATALLGEKGNNRRLLEMGCGLGLATIAAMEAGFNVVASDYYTDAIHMTRANAWRNLAREPETRLVNWRQWPNDLGLFDTITAADVLYEKEYATLVAECISRALAPTGTAMIADPGRLALPDFRQAVTANGLYISDTTLFDWQAHGGVTQKIQVMRIRHKAVPNPQ